MEEEVRFASPKGSTRLTSSLSNPNISTVKESVNVYTIESISVPKADLVLSSVAVVASECSFGIHPGDQLFVASWSQSTRSGCG